MNLVDEFGLDEERFIWQDLAMCEGIPTQAFFDDAYKMSQQAQNSLNAAAKDVCAYCPVLEMCKRDAIETKAYGVRAGQYYVKGKPVE